MARRAGNAPYLKPAASSYFANGERFLVFYMDEADQIAPSKSVICATRSGNPVKKFLGENGLLLGSVVTLWILAALLYFLSGRTTWHYVETRADRIIERLNEMYAQSPAAAEDYKKHLIVENFIREQSASLWEGIYLHLAIAFFVAGMLILGVDIVTRSMTRREFQRQTLEVSEAIWRALFKRFVPDSVARTIEGHLKSDVCRMRTQYTITFRREPYRDIPEGHIVVQRELYYGLFNLTAETIPAYPVRVQVLGPEATVTDSQGKKIALPAIRTLEVGGSNVEIKNLKEVAHPILLKRMKSDSEAIAVRSIVEELYETSDRALYMMTAPCDGLDLQIVNELRGTIELGPLGEGVWLTGGWVGKLKEKMTDHWTCQDGLLPGTALVISWKPIKAAAPQETGD